MSEDGLAQLEMQNRRTGCRRISGSVINEEGGTTWARGRIVWTLHEYRRSRFEKQGGGLTEERRIRRRWRFKKEREKRLPQD